ncbi:MAG: pyridoxal-phosphate dependent enzyme, partial [Acidimicrobiales bacterium]
VVVADGSGGTHAGLAAGFGDHRRVLGVDVGFGAGLAEQVAALAEAAAALTGRPAPSGEVQLDPSLPEPYGAPAAEVREALELAARTEGLVLDPVYTGRALAALIARRRDGRVPADQPVVFLHTGGLPALFTGRYRDWFAV